MRAKLLIYSVWTAFLGMGRSVKVSKLGQPRDRQGNARGSARIGCVAELSHRHRLHTMPIILKRKSAPGDLLSHDR